MSHLWPWLKQHWWLIVVGLVMSLGVGLRLWQFGSVPVSLYWDEMAIWDDALSVAATGQDMHGRSALQPLFISYGDYKLPVYIWLTSLVTWLTDNALVGARLVSLVAGLSMIPGIWLLLKQWQFSASTRWLGAMFLAVLPWSIHFSRAGFEGHLAAALVLWSLVGLFAWKSPPPRLTKKLILALGLLLLAVAAFYTYYSVRFVWPVLFWSALVLWWRELKPSLGWLIAVFGLWLVLIQPMFRADFYQASNELRLSTTNVLNQPNRPHEVNLFRERAGNSRLARVLFTQTAFAVRDLGLQGVQFFAPEYLFGEGDSNLRHGNGVTGLTWWSTAPLLGLGLLALWQKNRSLFSFILIWWLVGIVPAAVPLEVPHALRSLNALPVLPIVSAVGLAYVWQQWPKAGATGLTALLGLVFLVEVAQFSWHTLRVYPAISAPAWQDGYHQLAQYVAERAHAYDEVLVNAGDDRFFLYYLPQSDLRWAEVQAIPSQGFKRQHLGVVTIDPSESGWAQPAQGRRLIIQSYRAGEFPEHSDIITGATGQTLFYAYEELDN